MTMSSELLDRARTGDERAFGQLVEGYERELHVHCYRMLGSLADADDALQETLLGAWRGIGGFEGRSSVRTWLYRIATNLCLNMRRSKSRRPTSSLPPHVDPPAPTRLGEVVWLEPYPEVLLDELADASLNPAAHHESNETISLAFTTALQILPARQRAVLVLRDVLDYSADEVAAILDTTTPSVHSMLKRARASVAKELGSDDPTNRAPGSAEERDLVDKLTDAFAHGDVDKLIDLMTDDVWIRMPPAPLEYQGRELARAFFSTVAFREGRRYRAIPTGANRQPALGMYVIDPPTGIAHAMGLLVIDVAGNKISAITRFDNGVLGAFGLPRAL
jgi:RNA polymerase sigma-70 factor (TIGR02960 family)